MPARIAVFSMLLVVLGGCDAYKESRLTQADGPGRLPTRPTPSEVDAGSNLDQELVFALHNVRLDQSDKTLPPEAAEPWETTGLNLDDRNTRNDSDPDQLCQRPNSNGAYSRVDGLNGIDNMLGSTLWPNISTFVGSGGGAAFERQMNEGFESGKGTIVLRILRWNGTANDDSVDVWLFPAAEGSASPANAVRFMTGTNELELIASPGTEALPPSWDGTAMTGWYADQEYAFEDPGEEVPMMPKIRDRNGYIKNGSLVFALTSEHTINLRVENFASVAVVLSGANIVAKLSPDFATIEAGFIAGRFSLLNLFRVGGSVGLCENLASQVSELFNKMADVLADVTQEGGPSAICDAVSVGVGFTGVRGEYRGLAPLDLCLPHLCERVSCFGTGR